MPEVYLFITFAYRAKKNRETLSVKETVNKKSEILLS